MSLGKFCDPISSSSPAGSDCGYSSGFQRLTVFSDYLAARADVAELERQNRVDFQGENSESDRRSAEANAVDGRRNLEKHALAVKELTGRAPSIESARSEVVSLAGQLLTESGKDIRVVQHLTLAWIGQSGIAGLEAGFRLVDELFEQYGVLVHPQPDEDDPADVSARAMVISEMLSGLGFVNALRECVILVATGVGRFTGRDAEVIDGSLDDDRSDGARSAQHIHAISQALALTEPGDQANSKNILLQRVEEISRCLEVIGKVSGRFSVGALHGDRVPRLLLRIKAHLEDALEMELSAFEGVEAVNLIGFPKNEASSDEVIRAASGSCVLRNRNDARTLILEISKFLEETEPGHPAPLFLRRAERLLRAKDFFAIIRDMTPDVISELERITGHREDAVN